MAAKLPASKLRKFRHAIATLKKRGLISPSIDARKIKPTKHYESVIRRYPGIVSGSQTTVKVSRRKAKLAREELGFAGARDRVVIDKIKNQKIVRDKHDPFGFHVRFPGKVEHIEITGPRGKHFRTYFTRLEKAAARLQKPGYKTMFAARVYGHPTRQKFETIEQLQNALLKYVSIESAEDDNDMDRLRELIENVSLYRIPSNMTWYKRKPKGKRKRK